MKYTTNCKLRSFLNCNKNKVAYPSLVNKGLKITDAINFVMIKIILM
jgi:hypothetical protein